MSVYIHTLIHNTYICIHAYTDELMYLCPYTYLNIYIHTCICNMCCLCICIHIYATRCFTYHALGQQN